MPFCWRGISSGAKAVSGTGCGLDGIT